MSAEFYVAVYDLLIATGNVRTDSMKHAFVAYFTEQGRPWQCREWRFQGHLGFGGKFWRNDGRHYVSAYHEDITKERNRMIASLNTQIENLELEHNVR